VSTHLVFWFLAPWVALVQSIRSGHSVLGAAINCRVHRHLTSASNSFRPDGPPPDALVGRRLCRRYVLSSIGE
jgi:hypothetical protein